MYDYTGGKAWKIERQQRILEEAYRLFSEKSIEGVTMPEVAEASGVGRATVYRYYPTKLDLVVAIGTWTWNEYIRSHGALLTQEEIEEMSGAEYLRFFMDGFLDLYRNHGDLLRFNYDFNSYLRSADGSAEQKQPICVWWTIWGSFFILCMKRGRKTARFGAIFRRSRCFPDPFTSCWRLLRAMPWAWSMCRNPARIRRMSS